MTDYGLPLSFTVVRVMKKSLTEKKDKWNSIAVCGNKVYVADGGTKFTSLLLFYSCYSVKKIRIRVSVGFTKFSAERCLIPCDIVMC